MQHSGILRVLLSLALHDNAHQQQSLQSSRDVCGSKKHTTAASPAACCCNSADSKCRRFSNSYRIFNPENSTERYERREMTRTQCHKCQYHLCLRQRSVSPQSRATEIAPPECVSTMKWTTFTWSLARQNRNFAQEQNPPYLLKGVC